MNMMKRLEPKHAPLSNDVARRALRFRKLISLFERDEIEAGVDALLAYLDARQGDPDVEANGDEADGCFSEEDFHPHGAPDEMPGCPISDPDIEVDDGGLNGGAGDRTYAEWHTLPSATRRAGHIDGRPRDHLFHRPDEDAEDEGHDEPGAWTEWDGRSAFEHRLAHERIGNPNAGEDDEAEEDMCSAGDDRVTAGPVSNRGEWLHDRAHYHRHHGHEIGDEHDAESDLATSNIPVDPVRELEPNIFNGERAYVGHSNLLTSFRGNGNVSIFSVDSGRPGRFQATLKDGVMRTPEPGAPV